MTVCKMCWGDRQQVTAHKVAIHIRTIAVSVPVTICRSCDFKVASVVNFLRVMATDTHVELDNRDEVREVMEGKGKLKEALTTSKHPSTNNRSEAESLEAVEAMQTTLEG